MLKVIKRLLAAAVVIAAASAPSVAYARLNLNPPVAPAVTHPAPPAVTPSAARPEASSTQGFRWDDAGIGAAGMVVLIGMGAGAAAVIARRHGHQTSAG
jgi:hypothetical protein